MRRAWSHEDLVIVLITIQLERSDRYRLTVSIMGMIMGMIMGWSAVNAAVVYFKITRAPSATKWLRGNLQTEE